MIDPWYLANLRCPVDKGALTLDGDHLVSAAGRRYPVVDGMPVMLVKDVEQTLEVVAEASLQLAQEGDGSGAPWYLESVGLEPEQRREILRLAAANPNGLDPVALMIQGATSGYGYTHLIGDSSLTEYPIPEIALPAGEGRTLLDIGCNWGRWCFTAARKGYKPVGIDPSLGAVMAARRIARQLGLDIHFVVGDGRYLPFAEGGFDTVYSYSVIQHFSEEDAGLALAESGRVLRSGGFAKIQMAAKWGIRSFQHQVARGFRIREPFDVRYYGVPTLKRMFERHIGRTRVATDCYFGLGWQWSDYRFMRPSRRPILIASEVLRRASNVLPPMRLVADSIFCTATKA